MNKIRISLPQKLLMEIKIKILVYIYYPFSIFILSNCSFKEIYIIITKGLNSSHFNKPSNIFVLF